MKNYSGLKQAIFQIAQRAAGTDADHVEKGEIGYTPPGGGYNFHPNNDKNWLYVRVSREGSVSLVEALNIGVPILPDFPVEISYFNKTAYASPDKGRLLNYYQSYGAPMNVVPTHTHEPEYGLYDPVSPMRFRPGLVYVRSGLTVVISLFMYWKDDGTIGIIEDEVVDMTPALPAVEGFHRLSLLGINKATGVPEIRTIAAKTIQSLYTNTDYESFQYQGIDPLMFFDLQYGDTEITFQKMRNARIFGSSPLNVTQAGGTSSLEYGGTGSNLSLTGPGFLQQATNGANVSIHRYNLTATTDPTANDDSADGYQVGSIWINTTSDRIFQCVDATANAAIWKPLATIVNRSVLPTANDDTTKGFHINSLWYHTIYRQLWICLDATTGAAVWSEIELGLPWNVKGDILYVDDSTAANPTPTGVVLARDSIGDSVYVELPGCSPLQVIPTGNPITLNWNIWYSGTTSFPNFRKCRFRIRRDNLSGAILVDSGNLTYAGDSSGGHTNQWTGTFVDNAPTTGKYVMTFAHVESNPWQTYTDTRVFTANSPGVRHLALPIGTAGDALIVADGLPAWGVPRMSFAELTDVDMTTSPPTDDQVPKWSSALSKWLPGTVTGGGGGVVAETDLVYRKRIARTQLSEDGVFAFDLVALGAASEGFDRIIIQGAIRSTVASINDVVYIFFNEDYTVGNYQGSRQHGGSSHGGDTGANPRFVEASGATSPAGYFSKFHAILEGPFANDKIKATTAELARIDNATTQYVMQFVTVWEASLAPITKIEFRLDGHDAQVFAAGSWIELIGEKNGPIVYLGALPELAMNDLTDVDDTGIADGQTLVWNDTAGQYEPTTLPGPQVVKKTLHTQELLYDYEFGVAAAASPVFDLPSGYDYIDMEILGRTAAAVSHARVQAIINGELANTNYFWSYMHGSTSASASSAAGRFLGYIWGASASPMLMSPVIMRFYGYDSDSQDKVIWQESGHNFSTNYQAINIQRTVWKNLAPATTIQFDIESNYDFLAGTRIRLWGVKDRPVVVDGRAPDETPTPAAQVATFGIAGPLTISVPPLRITNVWGAAKTITKVHLAVDTAPTGASIIVDIHKNGTTIFTGGTNRPVILDSAVSGQTTTIDVPALDEGDYLQMTIAQVGSTIPGSDLTVQVVME